MLAALNLAFALADRPHAAAVAAAADQARQRRAEPSQEDDSGVDVAGLIRRLDMALGADGQLL